MNKLLFVIAISAIGYYIYNNHSPFQTKVTDPYFAEIRVRIQPGDVELVGIGKMNSYADCQARAALIWTESLKSLGEVNVQTECKKKINERYMALFDNRPIAASYVAMDRGTDAERDGRFIFYGLPSSLVSRECDKITNQVKQTYQGKVFCVTGTVG